jgi:AraC-like DNA-binding protein
MSGSGFHQRFKAVTALSPLQFQKQLRLQEARRLMLGEDLEAASAKARVGYHDPASLQSRVHEPVRRRSMRDVQRLLDEALPGARCAGTRPAATRR